jgi:hypothetical protein
MVVGDVGSGEVLNCDVLPYVFSIYDVLNWGEWDEFMKKNHNRT